MDPKQTEAHASSTGALADPCPDKTRADLEWDRVLEAIAERCVSGTGKRLARSLPFAPSRAAIITAMAEVREGVDLDIAGELLPSADLPDIEPALDRARIGSVLNNEEIRAVLSVMAASRVLRRFLTARKQKTPALFEACATDPGLDDVEREVGAAFDPDGTLADRASPRLMELRAEWRASRERLIRKLDELTRKHEDILQDRYWTERDGRYVLPVRSDAHERFPGIVHATSASGATVFVEPRALVEMGNRLKMVNAQVAREEEAIYATLTGRIMDVLPSLEHAQAALAHADVRRGSSQLAKDLRLTFPEIPIDDARLSGRDGRDGAEGPMIDLIGARHPLLLLDNVSVVPSDMAVRAGHAMVISGPNAGGKTIVLKTLGLAALMVRAGLPVPAAEGSRVSVFETVLTDVGDDQNLHKNLSTFSAHVQNLANILDGTRRGVVVLLDELAVGTDPREGEALAAAVLDSLCARGGAVGCTTHYEGLKALALGDPRFVNASVGFDIAAMSPTFRLAMGIPGASSALAVARRFGIPGTVLERAERFLSKETVTFDQMVEKLAAERRALELARADAEREVGVARDKQRELDREIERLTAKERGAITKEGEVLMQSLRRAREELRSAQARLRGGKPTAEDIRAAAKSIDAVGQKTAIGGELEPKAQPEAVERPVIDPDTIRVGMRVYVPRLRAEAEVVEVLPSGSLRVAAGPLKLTTTPGEVRGVGDAGGSKDAAGGSKDAAGGSKDGAGGRGRSGRDAKGARGKGREGDRGAGPRRFELDAAADPDVPIQTSENTVDLRGLRAHEAIAMAEQFLDRSLGAGRKVAFLIHGHGTGALRDGVRESLRGSKYVEKSRPGEPGEGGDGVTVVWLRW
jgi:DNA mismatch repair protein MutS2